MVNVQENNRTSNVRQPPFEHVAFVTRSVGSFGAVVLVKSLDWQAAKKPTTTSAHGDAIIQTHCLDRFMTFLPATAENVHRISDGLNACRDPQQARTYRVFVEWFAVRVHTVVIDTVNAPLEIEL